jgi:hypothetical protein
MKKRFFYWGFALKADESEIRQRDAAVDPKETIRALDSRRSRLVKRTYTALQA